VRRQVLYRLARGLELYAEDGADVRAAIAANFSAAQRLAVRQWMCELVRQ
jgi:hypothetical protein